MKDDFVFDICAWMRFLKLNRGVQKRNLYAIKIKINYV